MMIDYGFKFTNAAQAEADATILANAYNVTNGWLLDHVTVVQVWQPANDVTSGSPPVTTHTYLTGFYCIVSIDTPLPIPALFNHPNLAFALNRTAMQQNQSFVLKNNIGALISQIGVQPLFQSIPQYPVAGYS